MYKIVTWLYHKNQNYNMIGSIWIWMDIYTYIHTYTHMCWPWMRVMEYNGCIKGVLLGAILPPELYDNKAIAIKLSIKRMGKKSSATNIMFKSKSNKAYAMNHMIYMKSEKSRTRFLWYTETETKWPPFCKHFRLMLINKNCCILIKISQRFVHEGPINNTPGLI